MQSFFLSNGWCKKQVYPQELELKPRGTSSNRDGGQNPAAPVLTVSNTPKNPESYIMILYQKLHVELKWVYNFRKPVDNLIQKVKTSQTYECLNGIFFINRTDFDRGTVLASLFWSQNDVAYTNLMIWLRCRSHHFSIIYYRISQILRISLQLISRISFKWPCGCCFVSF